MEEVLYLPKQEGVEFLAFGYKNILADILWFNTVNYFGKHYKSDHKYEWLNHMCNLVVSLDPQAQHVYEFCALMLAWEIKKPDLAVAILSRGIENNPDNWRFHYLRGINYSIFFRDDVKAQEDFVAAAKKPEVENFVVRLASKKIANINNPQESLRFLQQMIKNSKDPNQRAVFEEHFKKVLHEVNLKYFQELLDKYVGEKGHLPERLEVLLSLTPKFKERSATISLNDPFGGKYFIDHTNSKVTSTSKIDRIKLFSNELSPFQKELLSEDKQATK